MPLTLMLTTAAPWRSAMPAKSAWPGLVAGAAATTADGEGAALACEPCSQVAPAPPIAPAAASVPGQIVLARWNSAQDAADGQRPSELITEDFGDVRFRADREYYTFAFLPEDRLEEIARMLSGRADSASAREHAAELLQHKATP